METYYLIDYENVGGEGLGGCEQLRETDHILIFFTRNAKTIDMRGIANHGEAKLDMIEVPAGKQSTDIHIGSYLGYLAGIKKADECRIVIVSKDTDYDNVRRFWTEKTGIEAERTQRIVPPQKKAASRPAAEKPAAKPSDVKPAARPVTVKPAAGRTAAEQNGSRTELTLTKEQKNELADQLRRAAQAASLPQEAAETVVKLAQTYLGQEHFLNKIHNGLQKEYPDSTKLYEAVKPVLLRFEARLRGRRTTTLRHTQERPAGQKKPAAAAGGQKKPAAAAQAAAAPAETPAEKKGVMSSLRRMLGRRS